MDAEKETLHVLQEERDVVRSWAVGKGVPTLVMDSTIHTCVEAATISANIQCLCIIDTEHCVMLTLSFCLLETCFSKTCLTQNGVADD